MVDTNRTPTNPDGIPFPLLERGDVVRLKEPYELSPSRHLTTGAEETAGALAAASIDPEDLPGHLDVEHVLHSPRYEDIDSAPPIRTFTHGIVAEIATRYPARDLDVPQGRLVQYQNTGGGPPRNVSLYPFNPETGLIFLDRGAGETGHPTFVDFHVQRLVPLFQPRSKPRPIVAVDETQVNLAGRDVYCWAAVDVQSFEIVHLDVTPRRSSLDALLFLRTFLESCRGKPLLIADHGSWYNWALELLGCRVRHEPFGPRSLIESIFFVLNYRLWRFWKRFSYRSSVNSTRQWCRAFAAIHNMEVLS